MISLLLRFCALLILSLVALPLVAACSTSNLGRRTGPDEWRDAMQAPLDEETAARLADGPSLEIVIDLAVTRSPSIQARRLQWLAAIHRFPQERSLKDPMVQGSYQLREIPPMMSMPEWSVGFTQQVPWWQKLWARGEAALAAAEAARFRYEAAVRDLIIDAKNAYYEIYYLDQAMPVTERIETLLRNEGVLAYSEMTIGRTAISEAFRAESQAAQLAYDRILLAEQRAAQAERLRSLLNLPPDTPIGPILTAPVYDVPEQVRPLYELAEQYAQLLRIRGFEVMRAEYETFLARLTRVPDPSIGLGVSKMPEFYPVMVQGGANLPIWEERNRALIRERETLESAMREEAMGEVNNVRQAVAQAYFRVRLTERLQRLYADVLLPQAESIMRQSEILFRSDEAMFSSLLETTLAYHNFILAYHRAVADYGQAVGMLERAIGTTAQPMQATEPMQSMPSGTPTVFGKIEAEGGEVPPAQPALGSATQTQSPAVEPISSITTPLAPEGTRP